MVLLVDVLEVRLKSKADSFEIALTSHRFAITNNG